ncbi:MAG: flagellar protein FlaG [Campylobacterales bacterium]
MEVAGLGGVRVAAEKKPVSGGADEARKMLEAVEATVAKTEAAKETTAAQSQEQMRERLERLAAEMNEVAKPLSTRISFGFSEEAGMMYLNVIDGDSGRLIRQFPSSEAMEFAAKMREWVGMLLDKTI